MTGESMPENAKVAPAGNGNDPQNKSKPTDISTDISNVPRSNGAVKAKGTDLLPFYSNDWGNALRLLALYGRDLKFCHAVKKWLVWDGKRWCVDATGRAKHLARKTMLEFLKQANEEGTESPSYKFARASLNAGPITSL